MKLAAVSDVHAMDRKPKNRTDKFPKLVLSKFKWILSDLKEKGIKKLLIGGDMFDSATCSHFLIARIGRMILKSEIEVIVVPGQHDMRFHTKGLDNTPLGILKSLDVIKIPTIENPYRTKKMNIYGCGWGDEDQLKDLLKNTDVSNDTLVIHRMVTKSKALFDAQIDWVSGKNMLKRFPFKLIISGDNHERFVVENAGQVLINSGSIVRLTKAQIEHVPGYHTYDTKTGEVKFYKIPILPWKEVFDEDKIEQDEEIERRTLGIKDIIEKIEVTREVSFEKVLHSTFVNSDWAKDLVVKNNLADIMERAKNKIQQGRTK